MKNPARTFLSLTLTASLAVVGCNSQQDKQKAAAAAAAASSATDSKQRAAAWQAAMEAQQIQATDAEKKHAAELQKQIERNTKKSKAMNKGSNVWRTYLP